jgi:hypothetical protein
MSTETPKSDEEIMQAARSSLLHVLRCASKPAAESHPDSIASGVLDAVFDLCSTCHRTNTSLASIFTSDEIDEMRAELPKHLSKVERGADAKLQHMHEYDIDRAKVYRSALQFLADDFKFLDCADAQILPQLAEITKWKIVAKLDCLIEDWSDAWTEFPIPPPKKYNLQGVPESHSWWTEDNRDGDFGI